MQSTLNVREVIHNHSCSQIPSMYINLLFLTETINIQGTSSLFL